MQTTERDAEVFAKDQSQNQIDIVNHVHHDEDNKRTLTRQEIIDELEATAPRTASSSAGSRSIIPSELRRSSDLAEMSRTETVRQDVRRLKSVTLGRMGKMFKTRTPVAERSSLDLDTDVTSVDDNYEKALKKEKTNSLGRMLKLVDKDGSPKKLFARPQVGSLSRILRRHPHNEDEVIDKSAEDPVRGIFSRMLSQLRGK